MKKGSPPRTSKIESERSIFYRELLRNLAVAGCDQSVTVYQMNSEPKPGKPWSIIPSDLPVGPRFTPAIKIYIANENYEKQASVKRVFLHNEYVTHFLLNALNICFEKFTTISFLQLKSCSLQTTEIESLYCILKKHPNIINLNLDGNPVPQQIYGRLIHETNIKFLSLKHCQINELGIKIISKYMICNKRLLVLDLSSNFIDDKAVEHLSAFLRQNRKLKSLILTDNWITDVGCKAIMQALNKFALNKDEIYLKRQLAFKYYHQRQLLLEQIKPPSTSSRRSSPRSTAPNLKNLKRFSKYKQPKKSKAHSQKMQHSMLPSLIKKDYRNDKEVQDYLDAHVQKSSHPFFNNISYENDKIYCTGNMTLIFLSLAYNKITQLGYSYMKEALEYQISIVASTRLMYILLNGNLDLDSTEAIEVNTLLEEQQYKISNGKSGESIAHVRPSVH